MCHNLGFFFKLINYDCKFGQIYPLFFHPVTGHFKKKKKCTWNDEKQRSFYKVKLLLLSDCLLVQYNPSKELILAWDASPHLVKAVLYHREADGH